MAANVLEPFTSNAKSESSSPGWAHKVALSNFQDMDYSDGIVAILNRTPSDEWVVIEIGIGIALRKAIFCTDDFLKCFYSNLYPLNNNFSWYYLLIIGMTTIIVQLMRLLMKTKQFIGG